jgi:asparagine synthase (glutamine-hydrolysing)
MSGIAGLVTCSGTGIDRTLLGGMADSLALRGPDRKALWCCDEAGFAHTLLATTGEAHREAQPYSLDGIVYITADCRIDGRNELRKELLRHGRELPHDASDPDFILNAYAVWQDGCVEHLLGDFSFAIWDTKCRRLFCARDQSGIKPFYYATVPAGIIFSNTLGCVRLHPAISDRLDDLAMLDYLLFGLSLELGTTSYMDIKALPPAHRLTWQDGHFGVSRYWERPMDEPILFSRSTDYVDRFEELLDLAVKDRLRTPTVSVPMSGGLDSTLLAASAKRVGGANVEVQAHSLYYDHLIPDDERRFAQIAADHLGISIEFLCGDLYKPYQRYDEIASLFPQPFNYPMSLFSLEHTLRMALHGRVYLYGEGPDNLLKYEWKAYLQYLRRERRISQLLYSAIQSFWLDPRVPFAFANRRRVSSGQSALPSFPAWLQADMVNRYDLKERWTLRWTAESSLHPFHPCSYGSMSTPDWVAIFTQADPGVSGVPIEARHPFLDLRLARFLLAIPVVPWCRRKLISRMVAKRRLPPEIWWREKTPLAESPLSSHLQRGNFDDFSSPSIDEFAKYVTDWPQIDPTTPWSLQLSSAPIALRFWWESQKRKH